VNVFVEIYYIRMSRQDPSIISKYYRCWSLFIILGKSFIYRR